ncbi:MAG: hypothetical protein ACR2PT_13705 [Endozoicomonas sp.]
MPSLKATKFVSLTALKEVESKGRIWIDHKFQLQQMSWLRWACCKIAPRIFMPRANQKAVEAFYTKLSDRKIGLSDDHAALLMARSGLADLAINENKLSVSAKSMLSLDQLNTVCQLAEKPVEELLEDLSRQLPEKVRHLVEEHQRLVKRSRLPSMDEGTGYIPKRQWMDDEKKTKPLAEVRLRPLDHTSRKTHGPLKPDRRTHSPSTPKGVSTWTETSSQQRPDNVRESFQKSRPPQPQASSKPLKEKSHSESNQNTSGGMKLSSSPVGGAKAYVKPKRAISYRDWSQGRRPNPIAYALRVTSDNTCMESGFIARHLMPFVANKLQEEYGMSLAMAEQNTVEIFASLGIEVGGEESVQPQKLMKLAPAIRSAGFNSKALEAGNLNQMVSTQLQYPGGVSSRRNSQAKVSVAPTSNKKSGPVEADPESVEITGKAESYLRKHNRIRLVVTYSRDSKNAKGMGHLASSRALLDNLIRLGYRGKIEIVYHDNPYTIEDLQGFFPGCPNGNTIDRTIKCPDGKEVRLSYVSANEVEDQDEVDLAVCGALDFAVDGKTDSFSAKKWELPNLGNSHKLVVLQPTGWWGSRFSYDFHKGKGVRFDRKMEQASYFYPDEPPLKANKNNAANRVNEAMKDSRKNCSEPLFNTIRTALTASVEGKAELMPMYGMYFSHGGRTVDSLVKAVRMNRSEKPQIFFNINHKYNPEEVSDPNVTVLDADNANTARFIRNAPPGSVIIVNSPPIPQKLFHLLSENGTFPLVLEGSGSASFASNKGVPFIALRDNGSLPEVESEKAGFEKLKSVAKWITGPNPPSSAQREELADVLSQARRPGSPVYRYYDEVKKKSRHIKNDQVAVAFSLMEGQ